MEGLIRFPSAELLAKHLRLILDRLETAEAEMHLNLDGLTELSAAAAESPIIIVRI